MNRFNSFVKLPIAVFGAAVMSAAFGATADDVIRGRVRAAHDGSVEVCFYNGYAPLEGAEFALLRNVAVAAPKMQSPLRRAAVGAIRLSHAAEHGCATATLLRGEAKAADWIVALRAGGH